MDRPEITYPCPWSFRIVGTDEAEVRKHVAEVAAPRPYELAPSRESSKGNYVSLLLELEVKDEAERNTIFEALRSDPSVKMVL